MRNCPTCQSVYASDAAVCPKDGSPLIDQGMWAEGSVVRGKYRILHCVGVGGMATVYKATHVHFHEVYALKVVHPSLIHDDVLVERFLREAVVTRRLHHPNAIRVDDIDRAEDGSPFMVMEFLEGQTLHEVLHYEGPLPYSRVCTIAGQVASALHAAHELGIIHRDIKPANITILKTPKGDEAKVLDFGIAKLKEAKIQQAFDNDFTLSVAGMVVGTPAYVSPEQAMGKRGSELDSRSDVYSFAVVVYQMLTNKLPVSAETEEQFVVAHAHQPAVPITNHIQDIPEPVAALIMRCLSKDPTDRPWDPRELTAEMQSWQKLDEEEPARVAQSSAHVEEPEHVEQEFTPTEFDDTPPPKSHVSRSWIITTLCAALLFTAAFVTWLLRGPQPASASPEADVITGIQPPSLSLPTGDMILIPGGTALLGEHGEPQQLRAFYIDKTEVSTKVYLEFCAKTNHPVPPNVSATDGNLPIRNVDYKDAQAFAAWAHKRLPTAAEWEKAARGTQGQHFPWGNDLGTGMARLPATPEEAQAMVQTQAQPSDVNSFSAGASSWGVLNLVGNVWEWVDSPIQIRGGSYQSYPPANNQTFESLVYSGQTLPPDTKRPDIGFRCAR